MTHSPPTTPWTVRLHLNDEHDSEQLAVLQLIDAPDAEAAMLAAQGEGFTPFTATDLDDGELLEFLGLDAPAIVTWDDLKHNVVRVTAEPDPT